MHLQLPLSLDSGDHSWDSDPEGGGEVVVFQPSGLNVSTYEHVVQAVQFLCSLSLLFVSLCAQKVSASRWGSSLAFAFVMFSGCRTFRSAPG